MKNHKKKFLILLLGSLLILSACGTKPVVLETTVTPQAVKVQTVAASLSAARTLNYPGIVSSESEATIAAKTSGTITGFSAQAGDKVSLGQELARIDDVNSTNFNPNALNSTQIKQAQIAVQQAQAAYQLSQASYDSLLVSSAKDLQQADISRQQAVSGQTNLNTTTGESLKSAQLAYETSQIATEQANLNLENNQKQFAQNNSSVNANASVAADSAANLAASIIVSLNNMLGVDDNKSVVVPYQTSLGALDPNSYSDFKIGYSQAKAESTAYSAKSFTDSGTKLEAAIHLAQSVKAATDEAKHLLDKSITAASLPASAVAGPSLSGFQTAVAADQAQLNAMILQAQAADQALANNSLGSNSGLDTLQKAYQLAQQQEAAALQNLKSLQAGNTSQTDQASFSVSLADNQYENLKIKIEAQLATAKTQVETSLLQYNNAQVALQNLYDIHSIVSPIDGTLSRKLVSNGDTVSAGQLVATVSQTNNLKVQFYIEAERLADIKPGVPAVVTDNNNKAYQGIVSSVSAQSDPTTHRFLAEIKLESQDGLVIGTVVNVEINLTISTAATPGLIILPLAAVNVGQNGDTIFIIDNGQAKSIPVTVATVIGELVEVKTDLPATAAIVIDGNQLIQDGSPVTIQP
jgi:RND family efflux transporter MFP subunit